MTLFNLNNYREISNWLYLIWTTTYWKGLYFLNWKGCVYLCTGVWKRTLLGEGSSNFSFLINSSKLWKFDVFIFLENFRFFMNVRFLDEISSNKLWNLRNHKVFKLMTFFWMNVRDASWHISFFQLSISLRDQCLNLLFLLSALKIISSCQLEITSFAWFLSSFNQLSIAYRLTKIMDFLSSFFIFLEFFNTSPVLMNLRNVFCWFLSCFWPSFQIIFTFPASARLY